MTLKCDSCVPINTKELQPTSFIFSLHIYFLVWTLMASSSSNPASKKTKRSRDTSPPPPMPEKYKIHGLTQDCWDKCHSAGRYGTEQRLVELYNNRIKRLEEHNKKDQEIILAHQNKVDLRNQEIEEIRGKIVDIYKGIQDSLYNFH